MRVFFNPSDPTEVWVTSSGNGLRVGTQVLTPIESWRYANFGVTYDIDDADPWVDSVVFEDVEHRSGTLGEDSRGVFAREGEHTAIVVGITVQVQEVWSKFGRQFSQLAWISAFADVDDAFEHPCCLSHLQCPVLD